MHGAALQLAQRVPLWIPVCASKALRYPIPHEVRIHCTASTTCPSQAVPYEMSLATVKKYIWKKSDDVVFAYSIRGPHPAPLPVITLNPS